MVRVLCLIAHCFHSVNLLDCDLQRFVWSWFAWSQTLLPSFSFTQHGVGKSLPTSPSHDWTATAAWQIKLGSTNNICDVAKLQKSFLGCIFQPICCPICCRLCATTCRCNRLRVIDCWNKVHIQYKYITLYAYYVYINGRDTLREDFFTL